jgi:hypothetical protein
MARATAGKDKEVDVRTEMRIALFWRRLIGDYEYIKYDPDDLLRWYLALELRGPDEIRDLYQERYTARPMRVMLGVVSKAPHPPILVIREWLAFHEHQVRTGSYWWGAIGFSLFCLLVFPNVYGCMALQPMNPLIMNPPATGPAQPTSVMNTPSYGAAPTFVPPTTMVPSVTVTGPTSGGIAGGAAGSVPAAGVTGPSNTGASGGAAGPP